MPNENSNAISCNIFLAKLVIQIKYTKRTIYRYLVPLLNVKSLVSCQKMWMSPVQLSGYRLSRSEFSGLTGSDKKRGATQSGFPGRYIWLFCINFTINFSCQQYKKSSLTRSNLDFLLENYCGDNDDDN